jgi:tetratricopeptide (TPR) repeat protein
MTRTLLLGATALAVLAAARFLYRVMHHLRQRLWEPVSSPVARGTIPASTLAVLDYAAPIVEAEGFRFSGYREGRRVSAVPGCASVWYALYHHPAHDVHAAVMVAPVPTQRWPFTVYLWSVYQDAPALLTVNGLRHELLPYPPSIRITDRYAPDIAAQVEAHLRAEAEYASRRKEAPQAAVARLPLPADFLAQLEAAGRVAPAGHLHGTPIWRMTVATALAYAWRSARGRARRLAMEKAPKGTELRMPQAPASVQAAAEASYLALAFANLHATTPPYWIRWPLLLAPLLLLVAAIGGPALALSVATVVLLYEPGRWLAARLMGYRSTGAMLVAGRGAAPQVTAALAGAWPGMILGLSALAWLAFDHVAAGHPYAALVSLWAGLAVAFNMLTLLMVLAMQLRVWKRWPAMPQPAMEGQGAADELYAWLSQAQLVHATQARKRAAAVLMAWHVVGPGANRAAVLRGILALGASILLTTALAAVITLSEPRSVVLGWADGAAAESLRFALVPEARLAMLKERLGDAEERFDREAMLSLSRQYRDTAARNAPGSQLHAEGEMMVARAVAATDPARTEFAASTDAAERILRTRLAGQNDRQDALLLADVLELKSAAGVRAGDVGMMTEALHLYEANANDDYRLYAARSNLALALDASGDAARAEQLLKKNLALPSANRYANIENRVDYAWFLLAHGRLDEAVHMLAESKAEVMDNRNRAILGYVARSLGLPAALIARQKGNWTQAAAELEPLHRIGCAAGLPCAARARPPLDPQAGLLLVEAYRKRGDTDHADELAGELRKQGGCALKPDARRWRAPLNAATAELKRRELHCG